MLRYKYWSCKETWDNNSLITCSFSDQLNQTDWRTFVLFIFIDIQLIYNVALGSDIQENDSAFRFFSIIGYYKILKIVSSYIVGPCLSVLYKQCISVNPQFLIYPPPPTFNFTF